MHYTGQNKAQYVYGGIWIDRHIWICASTQHYILRLFMYVFICCICIHYKLLQNIYMYINLTLDFFFFFFYSLVWCSYNNKPNKLVLKSFHFAVCSVTFPVKGEDLIDFIIRNDRPDSGRDIFRDAVFGACDLPVVSYETFSKMFEVGVNRCLRMFILQKSIKKKKRKKKLYIYIHIKPKLSYNFNIIFTQTHSSSWSLINWTELHEISGLPYA